MKKLLLMMVVALILVFFVVGVASANGGPHGGYTATTDACAGCHRAHTASGPNLLIADSTLALCLTCHGNSATGAQTNVTDGVYEGTAGSNLGTAMNGGGFDFIDGAAVTSNHDVSGTITQAWGVNNRGVLADFAAGATLDCASCHDPHGTAGYRLLVAGPIGAGDDYDSAAKDYTAEAWSNTTISTFCASCHTAYHETVVDVGNDETALTVGGNGVYTFTHRIDMTWNDAVGTNVTAASFGTNNPETQGYDGVAASGDEIPLAGTAGICTTCHFPHGSAAVMTGGDTGNEYADGGPTGSGTLPGNTTATDSALLRLDRRGVCQACHQK